MVFTGQQVHDIRHLDMIEMDMIEMVMTTVALINMALIKEDTTETVMIKMAIT